MRAIPIKIYSVTLLLALFAMACHTKQPNKLVDAASPYLQAHAKDPVNWYEWGDEALQLAQSTHKPLLISIGYSACHWCHVMQQESYTDTAVARLMNENFICVKVDREERPDIDARYTDAAELLTGSAGWPLHAFALPDGRPFFAGTYYEKQRWMSLLTQISTAYKTKYSTVLLQAQGIANGIADRQASLLQVDSNQQDRRTQNGSRQTFRNIVAALDSTNGGIKGTIKFPNPPLVEYLLQTYFLDNNQQALALAQTTLNKMAMGAIFDQAGGGFARYSTDSLWRQPHFEKMLYSNAQLLSVYAHAYQLTGAPLYKTVLHETASCMIRDLESPEGGYYSSVNADSKDGEGLYYSWTSKEIDQLQQPLGRQLAAFYNVNEQGNWQGLRSLLYTTTSAADFARMQSIDSTSFVASLSQFKNALLQEREKRNRPSIDKKIIVGWNALAITGFLDVFAALGDSLYLQKALAAARCIEIKLLNNKGQLSRYYANGKASAPAGLEDYAYCCEAFVQLYQTTFDKHWLDLARAMATQCIRQFVARGHTALFGSTAAADTGYATIPLSD
ncbi:MAG TPA: thioredoxin domain-containing protein, partial [Chitinophagaceae bacterium]|nr:thioredoxin domain-containing protein [Chitinophagaceae bacterium]